jgi:putative transposase
MNANQADLPVQTMCRILQVSASGYYAWRERAPASRTIANAVLTERIRRIHADSDSTYGMPRVRAEMIDQGERIARTRVARLMRHATSSRIPLALLVVSIPMLTQKADQPQQLTRVDWDP